MGENSPNLVAVIEKCFCGHGGFSSAQNKLNKLSIKRPRMYQGCQIFLGT
jgi:hypothetical protein